MTLLLCFPCDLCTFHTMTNCQKHARDTYILYTYKYRRLETSRLISHECHTKSLQKSHESTSDRHGNNGFVKHTKFPTIFICYGKFRPHFKTKKSNNIQIFANPQAWRYLRVTAVQPPRISNHILNSHWLARAAMMAVCSHISFLYEVHTLYYILYEVCSLIPENIKTKSLLKQIITNASKLGELCLGRIAYFINGLESVNRCFIVVIYKTVTK